MESVIWSCSDWNDMNMAGLSCKPAPHKWAQLIRKQVSSSFRQIQAFAAGPRVLKREVWKTTTSGMSRPFYLTKSLPVCIYVPGCCCVCICLCVCIYRCDCFAGGLATWCLTGMFAAQRVLWARLPRHHYTSFHFLLLASSQISSSCLNGLIVKNTLSQDYKVCLCFVGLREQQLLKR